MADKFMKAYRRTLDGIVVTVACPSSGGFEIDFNGEVIAQTSTKNAAQKIINTTLLERGAMSTTIGVNPPFTEWQVTTIDRFDPEAD